MGSDIDLLIQLDPEVDNYDSFLETWKSKEDFMFPYYEVCTLSIDGIREDFHQVTALVYDPSDAQYAPQIPKGVEEIEGIQGKTLEELFEWNLNHVEAEIWYSS